MLSRVLFLPLLGLLSMLSAFSKPSSGGVLTSNDFTIRYQVGVPEPGTMSLALLGLLGLLRRRRS